MKNYAGLLEDFRSKEIEALDRGLYFDPFPLIHLVDPNSSDSSTFCLRLVLERRRIPYSWVNVVECCREPKLLMQMIINDLQQQDDNSTKNKVTNQNTFLRQLTNHRKNGGRRIVIVLEAAEKLSKFPPVFTEFILGISELANEVVCSIVLRSKVGLDWLGSFDGKPVIPPLTVQFPNFESQQLAQLIHSKRTDCSTGESAVHEAFASQVVDVFHQITSDLRELSYAARNLWQIYIKPVREGKIECSGPKAAIKLWMASKEELRIAFNGLYLRSEIRLMSSSNDQSQVSSANNLEVPKYRCNVKLETIKVIAATLDFDIMSSLYDFNAR